MATAKEPQSKIWYLPGPFFRYKEDVKALARKAGLVIVDANVAPADKPHAADDKDLPKVSLKPEYDADAIRKAAELAASLTKAPQQ